MRTLTQHKTERVIALRILLVIWIAAVAYCVFVFDTASQTYDDVSRRTEKVSPVASTAKVGEANVKIPSYDMFASQGIWALVSKKRVLDGDATYPLVDIPIAHGDAEQSMKIATVMSDELQQLANAAEADGEPLMVSSAYRSRSEQKELYDQFVEENGETLAKQYVSPPGASEHQTGLSVDFSSVSSLCSNDSDDCSLSQSGAAWLSENAYKFGFIQRYPEGKSDLTGIAFEPWHFRFVGKPLANAMHDTSLTLDEVVGKLAPGYAKQRQ